MKPKTRRVASVLLAALALAVVAAVTFVKSSWGEKRARVAVESAVSEVTAAPFAMERLGDFELFSPLGIVRGTAKNIRMLDTEGGELLSVGQVTAEVDLWALLRSELHVRSASVSGAQIPCDIETGRPRIALPSNQRSPFRPRSMALRLENIAVTGLYAVAAQPDGKKVILGRLSGEFDLLAPRDQPGVQMDLRGIEGVLSRPQPLRVHDATGVVDTGAQTVADIRFRAIAQGAAVSGRARYVPADDREPLKIDIESIHDFDPRAFGNPLDALGGKGLPTEMFRKLGVGPFGP